MNGLLYCLVVVIWGTTWIAIYLQQGPVAAPVSIFWRFAIASTVMIAILLISGKLRKLSGRDHLFCLLQGGCVFCFNFWCFYTAAAWINTGLESVIFSMAVLFNAVNSYLFFGQKPPRRFYVAAGLGLTGIVTLFWQDLVNSGLNHSLLLGISLSALGTFGFSLGIGPSKAAYSTLLFPLVALTLSTLYEGYVWQVNAIVGLVLILLGNLVMFARPETLMGKLVYRRRAA